MTKRELSNELAQVSDLYSFIVVLYICIDAEDYVGLNGRYQKVVNSSGTKHLNKFQTLSHELLIINRYEFKLWLDLWIGELKKSPFDAAICSYHSLLRIDGIVKEFSVSKKILIDKGPFGSVNGYSLFFKKPIAFFDEALKNIIRRGRQTVEYNPNSFNYKFNNFEIIKDEDLHGYKPIVKQYNIKSGLCNSIKIALFPIGSQSWFQVKQNHTTRQFEIEYYDSELIKHNVKIKNSLDEAEASQSDIIILPELALNIMTETTIKSHVLENNFSNLKLCFLGSLWGNNKNESLLMSSNGTILIKQTKKAPYSFYDKTKKEMYYENINTQNKDITFIDVEGLGRLAYLICADFNDESINSVCAVMHADFVFVSSYTNSTVNMNNTAEDIAKRKAISTVLVNTCAAIPLDMADKTYCFFVETPKVVQNTLSHEKVYGFLCDKKEDCKTFVNFVNIKSND